LLSLPWLSSAPSSVPASASPCDAGCRRTTTAATLTSAAYSYRATIETELKQTLIKADPGQHRSPRRVPASLWPRDEDASRAHTAGRRPQLPERWPGEDFGSTGPTPDAGRSRYVDVQRQSLALQPADPAQRWFQSQALQVTERLSELRWLVLSQGTATAPLVPVFILIFFSTIAIFGSFALFVPPNPTVITVLSLAALAIAGATFLIVELNSPFHGLLQIPSQGARIVAQMLGQ
jgi:hypothetical protein